MNNKEKILHILLENEKPVSGEIIGEKLKISRKMIWKYMNQLKQDGYDIISKNNNGYLINKHACTLKKEFIAYYLNKPMNIYCYDSIDSTSTKAKELSMNSNASFIVCSKMQTNGRGRTGKSFYSPLNGLYFSLVLKGEEIKQPSLITIQIGVCVMHVLKEMYNIEVELKWVNDIYYHGKKVCGILSEAISDFESGQLESLIIGVGLNINLKFIPEELQSIAGTLNINDFDYNLFIATLVNEIKDKISQDNSSCIEEFNEHSILMGKEISFTYENKDCQGIAGLINDEGNLIVKQKNREIILKSGMVSLGSKAYEK